MTKFQIGDRVVINDVGFRQYGYHKGQRGCFGNPRCEGTVFVDKHSDWVRVEWDDGTHNSYSPETLDLVITSLENE